MSARKEFDPKVLIDDTTQLGATGDGIQAAALRLQADAHRQRLAAARRRLEIAQITGDDAAIARATEQIDTRSTRLESAEMQFALANVVPPVADEKTAQIAVAVLGESDAPPLCVTVLGDNGEHLKQEKVGPAGAALFSLEGAVVGVRLLVSDAKSRVHFRDAVSFDAPLGAVTRRVVRLSGPVEECAPAPAALTMPKLIGQDEATACAILYRLGVSEITTTDKPDDGPAGLVIGQSPKPGAPLDPAAGANLVVSVADDSTGEPATLDMPNFVGKQIQNVEFTANKLKIKLKTKWVETSEIADGEVFDQEPAADTTVEWPFSATVTVSKKPDVPNPELIIVPKFVGHSEKQALEIAKKAGVEVAISYAPSQRPKDEVFEQAPAAGAKVPLPLAVKLTVSSGQGGTERVEIPDVVGKSIIGARRLVERLGIALVAHKGDGGVTPGTVFKQSPKGRAVVPRPATLTVFFQQPRNDVNRSGFAARLMAAVAADPRFAELQLDGDRLERRLVAAAIDGPSAAKVLIALDNAALAERLGLANLTQARRLRPVLRRALKEMS